MSIRNRSQLGPSPAFPERGDVTVDAIIAQNARRAGSLYAEEGLGLDPRNAAGFRGGRREEPGIFDVKVADGRGVLGRTNRPPSWDEVDLATGKGLAQGIDDTQHGSGPMLHQPRAGANYQAVAPMDGFARGERSTPRAYETKLGENPRTRRNPADISDLRY